MKKLAKKSKNVYAFASPRLELAGRECTVDGLESIIEYSSQKITLSLGSQLIVFNGFDLKISSFTSDGAIVEGSITSMEFKNC